MTNVYQFKWQVYSPQLRGCANDGTATYTGKNFEDAYKKLKTYLEKHWTREVDFEVFSTERILVGVKETA